MKTSPEFVLNCSDESFKQRQKNVFDQLFKIEENVKKKQDQPMELESKHVNHFQNRSCRSHTKSFRGKESIFKMPQEQASRHFLRRLPDYKKNPHKWTKYSLEDVKDEDISDKGNTKAALSFLKELNERNNKPSNMSIEENVEELPKKIIFQKHVHSNIMKEVSMEEKPSFKSSKIIMPEYVVGQKIKKEKKNRHLKSEANKKEMKLDHLFEEEDQD